MIATLAKSVREYRREAVLTPLCVGVEVILEVTITYLMADLIDKGIDAGDMGYILKMGGLLVLCALVSLLFGALSGRYAAMASTGFAKNLRQDMYHNVQTFAFANIDRFSTASLITRLTTDVVHVQHAFMMLIRVAVRSPMMLLFSMAMSFRINSRIALVFLGAAPVLGAGIYLIMSRAHPIFEGVFRTYDKLNRVVQENLRGIRVVKAFVKEDHEREKFSSVSAEIYRSMSRAQKLVAFNMPLMQACMYACILLASYLGANIIVEGGMTTGQLMSVLTYAMSILTSLMMLSMVFMMITVSRASAGRICEVLNEKPSLSGPEAYNRTPAGGTALPGQPGPRVESGEVEFRGVSFSYSGDAKRMCLRDVDLHIQSGETIGIIGGTGSGKSTLVQLIPRLYDATSGTVLVGGRDVKEYGLGEIRGAVSMVLQKNELFSGTVAENLRWGDPGATEEELSWACRLAQAEEFILKMEGGYGARIERGGANLSGGQRQRLCIARALLKRPKILILDDSTSAVDTATDAAIRRAFREELPHVTKFIIAQRIASVQDADRIIVMDNGRIEAFGSHDELMEGNRVYREIYHSQQKGGDFDE